MKLSRATPNLYYAPHSFSRCFHDALIAPSGARAGLGWVATICTCPRLPPWLLFAQTVSSSYSSSFTSLALTTTRQNTNTLQQYADFR